MEEAPTKEDIILELEFAIYGCIALIKEYSECHIRRKNSLNSPIIDEIQGRKIKDFNQIDSLKRLKKTAKQLDELLTEYSQYILDN